MKKIILTLTLTVVALSIFAATGTIIVKNPNGKSMVVETENGKIIEVVVPGEVIIDGIPVGAQIEFHEGNDGSSIELAL